MTEKELVEKLKAALKKKWADIEKEDLEREKKADLKKHTEKEKGEIERLYKEDFEEHDRTVLQIEKATKLEQLTGLVRRKNWDAQAWTEFIFENGFESKIEIGSLAGFDT
ncbi:hypothetical protein CEE34_10980 [Candidatus Aerophobetes bacterium Ae_b3a]|nr:MAG: hypothetical protein CEE34_10980 [Candidatus Aerophobetes bacterium Ae_b3a]